MRSGREDPKKVAKQSYHRISSNNNNDNDDKYDDSFDVEDDNERMTSSSRATRKADSVYQRLNSSTDVHVEGEEKENRRAVVSRSNSSIKNEASFTVVAEEKKQMDGNSPPSNTTRQEDDVKNDARGRDALLEFTSPSTGRQLNSSSSVASADDVLSDSDALSECESDMMRYSAAVATSPELAKIKRGINGTSAAQHETEAESTVQSILWACISGQWSSIPALFQQIRTESRRKRVQRALALEDTEGGSLSHINGYIILCLSSYCDLSEVKGMFVAVAFLLGFLLAYHFLDEAGPEAETLRDGIWFLGIVIVALRCLWWPVYWCVWGRRVHRVS